MRENTAIRNAIVEMISGASENDLIRISEKTKLQDIEGHESGQVEPALMLATKKGAKVRALVEFSEASRNEVKKMIATSLGDTLAITMDAIKKGHIMIKTPSSQPFPNKLVALNKEAMVISLIGKGITADDGIFLLRESYVGLFTEILNKFDSTWEEATNVLDVLFEVPS
ncbi:MAG: hypothetical protein ACTSUB_03440 [Candidatus Thorarchaeota archaeon]